MKIWLDDVRPTPAGWVRCYSTNQFIALMEKTINLKAEAASLDHDLGDYHNDGGDGYKAVLWMAEHEVWPNQINVHSANPVGVQRMLGLIDHYGPYTRRIGVTSRSL